MRQRREKSDDLARKKQSDPNIAPSSGAPITSSDATVSTDAQDDIRWSCQCPHCGLPIQDSTLWFAQRYPLLTTLLLIRERRHQATYTISDVAHLLGVSVRAVQDRVATGQLSRRDLPGWAKFFPDDLEDFLRNSKNHGKR
jgi:hypothetical protein